MRKISNAKRKRMGVVLKHIKRNEEIDMYELINFFEYTGLYGKYGLGGWLSRVKETPKDELSRMVLSELKKINKQRKMDKISLYNYYGKGVYINRQYYDRYDTDVYILRTNDKIEFFKYFANYHIEDVLRTIFISKEVDKYNSLYNDKNFMHNMSFMKNDLEVTKFMLRLTPDLLATDDTQFVESFFHAVNVGHRALFLFNDSEYEEYLKYKNEGIVISKFIKEKVVEINQEVFNEIKVYLIKLKLTKSKRKKIDYTKKLLALREGLFIK